MSGRIDFTMDFNTKRTAHKSDSDNFFRFYILGDFSGRSDVPWEQRKIRKVDSDNFDQVINLIMPTFEIDTGLALKIETLDDFHPDTWFGKIQILADLQKLKKELSNPSTAEQAAMKIQAYYPSETKNDNSIPTKEAPESQEDILQRLLGKSPKNTIGRKTL
jgi:type VI secretion system ImpB/VipA family protein